MKMTASVGQRSVFDQQLTSCFQGVINGQPYTAYRSPLDTNWKRQLRYSSVRMQDVRITEKRLRMVGTVNEVIQKCEKFKP